MVTPNMMPPLGNLYFLLTLPAVLYSEKLSPRSVSYLEAFEEMFPWVDVKSQKVFDFVANKENLKRIMLLNGLACRERQESFRSRRVTRSVYKLFGLPIDLMYSTPVATTESHESNADAYGYIHQDSYDNFNLTSSEAEISKDGWDYSPYIPPGESTTEFIFPSWNYDGRVPVAFWKDWTNHETDCEQSTFNIPDDVKGYTDKERAAIHTFEDFYNTFFNTLYSIPHRCDNYTSIFTCLQGKEILEKNVIDPYYDPVD